MVSVYGPHKALFLDDSKVEVMEEGCGTPELLTLWHSGNDRSNRRGSGPNDTLQRDVPCGNLF